jgi:hypothetical protein
MKDACVCAIWLTPMLMTFVESEPDGARPISTLVMIVPRVLSHDGAGDLKGGPACTDDKALQSLGNARLIRDLNDASGIIEDGLDNIRLIAVWRRHLDKDADLGWSIK